MTAAATTTSGMVTAGIPGVVVMMMVRVQIVQHRIVVVRIHKGQHLQFELQSFVEHLQVFHVTIRFVDDAG